MGAGHACARLNGMGFSCWGGNAQGQLGADAGPDCIAGLPLDSATLNDIRLSVHGTASCAISDGDLYCWGSSLHTGFAVFAPELIADFEEDFSFLDISARTGCAISAGALYCWGSDGVGTTEAPQRVGVGSEYRRVSVGVSSACAIDAEEHLYCWGDNSWVQLGLGDLNNRPEPTQVTIQQNP